MRRFLIEYIDGGEIKAEFILASTSTAACRKLADKLRKRRMPVTLNLSSIKEVRV